MAVDAGDKDRGLAVVLTRGAHASVVLDFLSLHNVKGVAGMSDIKLHLPLPTTFILFVAATDGAS